MIAFYSPVLIDCGNIPAIRLIGVGTPDPIFCVKGVTGERGMRVTGSRIILASAGQPFIILMSSSAASFPSKSIGCAMLVRDGASKSIIGNPSNPMSEISEGIAT
jgi:hypothetical protein